MRNRLTYANVTATLALVIAVAGGTAYAADTVFSSDIVDGEVKSVDIGNSQVVSADVRNGVLNDEDIAQGTFVNFAASIGGADHVIAENACELGGVEGVNAAGDHMLLTAENSGPYVDLDFSIRYHDDSSAILVSCNNGIGPRDTSALAHFNLLVFDAQ